jgi:hypothetical protein
MIGVLYEHPEWFKPLFATLDRRGLPHTEARLRQLLTDFRFDTMERMVNDARLVIHRDERMALSQNKNQSVTTPFKRQLEMILLLIKSLSNSTAINSPAFLIFKKKSSYSLNTTPF